MHLRTQYRPSRLLLAAFLFAAQISALAAQSPGRKETSSAPFIPGEKLQINGVHNAGKIGEGLFRGGQPKEQGFAELKKLGITTVVNLRSGRGEIERERKQVESLGMRYVSFPNNGWSPPKDEQVAQFLSLLRDHASEKFFVHCRLGEDRTGVFIATYRIASQQWSSDDAIRELNAFGFHGFWLPAMRKYVRDFPARYVSAPAFAPLRSPSPNQQE